MVLVHWKTALAAALCAAAFSQPGLAQVATPSILRIDVANNVLYQEDTSDVSKFATDPNVVAVLRLHRNYYSLLYSVLALFRIGTSESASFQRVKNAL